MLLFDRKSWLPHIPWLVFVLCAVAAASVWFFGFTYSGNPPAWPGGSSLPGLTFGVLGGILILFEFLLWFRKKVRVWRIGRAQTWLRAHIWLGLLCGPLLVYHSGLRLGGPLSTVLMILLLIVLVSGVWGLVLQNLLPTRMLEQIPAETIYSQIDRLSSQLSAEARELVRATCGPDDGGGGSAEEAAARPRTSSSAPFAPWATSRGRFCRRASLPRPFPAPSRLGPSIGKPFSPFFAARQGAIRRSAWKGGRPGISES